MKWLQKNTKFKTIEDVVEANSGLPLSEFFDETIHSIKFLDEIVQKILNSRFLGPITIVGDYDADGITGSAIMYRTLKTLDPEIDLTVRLPKRFSEGYGLSEKIIDEISEGLIITIDNGISSYAAIKKAKDKGLDVVIIDHHMPPEILPPADIIVNPHVYDSEFKSFCGAGLSYRVCLSLINELDKDNVALKDEIVALAAIGTVADVMPLIKDNRRIVINGLDVLNNRRYNLPLGLVSLLDASQTAVVTETTIGFKIGPILNAAGRLFDDGALKSFYMLTFDIDEPNLSYNEANEIIISLLKINDSRKGLTLDAIISANNTIAENYLFNSLPLCIYDPEIPEGIAGLVAGRLAEQYKCPTFVLTNDHQDNTLIKGSGRSYQNFNLKKLLDNINKKLPLVKYGGHSGAAGLSIKKDDFDDFFATAQIIMNEMGFEIETEKYYDLEISSDKLQQTLIELGKFAPYGEGNRKPIFKINDFLLSPRYGKFYNAMGSGNDLKLFGKNCSAIGFGMVEKYEDMSSPRKLNLYGTISENNFNNHIETQVEMIDLECAKIDGFTSDLANSLANKLSNF